MSSAAIDPRILGFWTIVNGDYGLTDEYRANGTVVGYVGGRRSSPIPFRIDGEYLTYLVKQPDGSVFEQKARFKLSGDTLTFFDSPRRKRVFRRTEKA